MKVPEILTKKNDRKGEFCRFSVLFRPGTDFYTNPTRSSSTTSLYATHIVKQHSFL